jgi:iron complex outermembrane receptor protein
MLFNAYAGKRFSRALLCGASLSALALALTMVNAAQAQEEGSAPVESVTVTGTMIKGINPVGSNLVTMDAGTIKATGAMSTDQLLSQIPQISNTFNSTATAQTEINLGSVRPVIRYIPSQAIVGGSETLVLMNGQNMVGVSGLATAPDPGMIPTGVLSQVAVMPDGASSVYGANAITGVINFVTRKDYEGFEANASAGVADGYTSLSASAMVGTSWNSGGAYLAFEHKSNTRLAAADRSYMNMDLTSIGGRDSRSTNCALPNISAGSQYYAMTGTPDGSPGSLAANVSGPYPGLDPVTNAGSLNRCDTNSTSDFVPREEQDSVFGSMHQHIMEGVDFSTTVLWSNHLASRRDQAQQATVTVDNTNPYFQSLNGETSQTILLNFSSYLGKNYNVAQNDMNMLQVTPKLTIALPFRDWELDLEGNYGRSVSNGTRIGRDSVDSTALNVALRQQMIGGVMSPTLVASSGPAGNAVDPYNLNMTNPAVMNAILDVAQIGKAVQHVMQYSAQANGTLFSLPGGDVKGAIGAKYGWDDYISKWFINAPIGQTWGNHPNTGAQTVYAKTHRATTSIYGEVVVPLVSASNSMTLVKNLTLDVSGRSDDYSDFGSTNNYKIGFTWDVVDALTFRGTKGTSYDAPSLADTLAPDGRYYYSDNSTSPNTSVPPGTSAADALRPSISVPGGNPNLGPELGSTWSLGADFHPTTEFGVDLTGLDVSITRWHIFIENQIGLPPFGAVRYQNPAYSKFYIINPTEAQVAAYGYSTFIGFPGADLASAYAPGVSPPYIINSARRNNIGNAALEGFDWSAKYTTDIDNFGVMTVGTSGTVSTKDATQAAAGAPWSSIQQYGAPLYSATAFLRLENGPWSGRVWVNYSPGFAVNPGTLSYSLYNQTRMGSFHPINIYTSYALDDVADWTSGATVGLTVNNITDEAPPLYLEGGNASPTNGGQGIAGNGSTLGRYVVLNLQKKF